MRLARQDEEPERENQSQGKRIHNLDERCSYPPGALWRWTTDNELVRKLVFVMEAHFGLQKIKVTLDLRDFTEGARSHQIPKLPSSWCLEEEMGASESWILGMTAVNEYYSWPLLRMKAWYGNDSHPVSVPQSSKKQGQAQVGPVIVCERLDFSSLSEYVTLGTDKKG
jgi:hypothetical protein